MVICYNIFFILFNIMGNKTMKGNSRKFNKKRKGGASRSKQSPSRSKQSENSIYGEDYFKDTTNEDLRKSAILSQAYETFRPMGSSLPKKKPTRPYNEINEAAYNELIRRARKAGRENTQRRLKK